MYDVRFFRKLLTINFFPHCLRFHTPQGWENPPIPHLAIPSISGYSMMCLLPSEVPSANCILPARQKAGDRSAGSIFLPVDMPSAMHDVPSAKMVQGSRAGMKQLAEGSCEVGRYASARCDLPSAGLTQGFFYQPGQQTGQARSWHRAGLRSAFCTGLAEGVCLLPA